MSRVLLVAGLVGWAGLALLLSEVRWFRRVPLVDRVAPYVPGVWGRSRVGLLSVESFRQALGPFAQRLGARTSLLLGVQEPLERRLRRIHADIDATELRVRQLGWSLAAMAGGVLLGVALRPAAPVVVLLALGAPVLAFLVEEQRVARADQDRQRRLRLELPVVAEQLGMLLGSGWSLFAALDRLARRGSGAVAADLARVVVRVRQGSTEAAALREWADLAAVPEVTRLVQVLALERDTADLGGLISAEARTIRRSVHREQVELLARRAQQVWIPVTVATLLPGVLFVAVPFLQAVDLFAGTP